MQRWKLMIMISLLALGSATETLAKDLAPRLEGSSHNVLSPWYLSDVDRWWHVDGLLGAGAEPDYPGSDDREAELGGFLRVLLKDRFGNRYHLGLEEVGARFYLGERWALGVDLEIEEGRETENDDLRDLPPGDESLALELALHRRLGKGYASLLIESDALDSGKGNAFALAYRYEHQTPQGRWLLSPGFDISWADREHMQAEFGLIPGDAAILGLTPYAPESGLKSSTVGLLVQRFFGSRWSLLGLVEAELYHGEAADSPLIDELGSELTFETTLGVYFRF